MTRLHRSREPSRYRKRGMFLVLPMGVKTGKEPKMNVIDFGAFQKMQMPSRSKYFAFWDISWHLP